MTGGLVDPEGVGIQSNKRLATHGGIAAEDTPDGLIPQQLEDAGAGGADVDQRVIADGVAAIHLQRASSQAGHAGEVVDAGKPEGTVTRLREGVRATDGGGHDERAGRRGDIRGEDQFVAGTGNEAASGEGRRNGSAAGGGGLQDAPGSNREDPAIGEGDGGISGRIETQRADAEILRERAGIPRGAVGDVVAQGPGGDIRFGHGRDEHDASGAVVGGEVRDARGVGRGRPSAEDTIEVGGGGPEAVRGILGSDGEIEADRAGGGGAGERAQREDDLLGSSRREPQRAEAAAGEVRAGHRLRGVRGGVAEQDEVTAAVERQGASRVDLGSIQGRVIQEETPGRQGGVTRIRIGACEEQITKAALDRTEGSGR